MDGRIAASRCPTSPRRPACRSQQFRKFSTAALGRFSRDPRSGRATPARARLPAPRLRRPARAVARMIELVFHELESEWAIEIIRGVERVTREAGISLILTESGDRHSPGHAWIDGVLRRRPIGVILVFSDLEQVDKHKLRSRGVNFVVVDPGRRAGAGRCLDRLGELVRRSGRSTASDQARTPADRDDQRPRGHAVLDRPRRRIPLGARARRYRLRPEPAARRRLPRRRRPPGR